MIRFEVPGDPVAKGRPKFVTAGKFPRAVTPKATVDFENRVRFAAQAAGVVPIDGPVELHVFAFSCMPKTRHRKRNPRTASYRTKKPDGSNVLKAVEDALNGIAYADDSQVAAAHVYTIEAAQGQPGRTVVNLRRPEPIEFLLDVIGATS